MQAPLTPTPVPATPPPLTAVSTVTEALEADLERVADDAGNVVDSVLAALVASLPEEATATQVVLMRGLGFGV